MIVEALTCRANDFDGRLATPAEVERLTARLGDLVPPWFTQMLAAFRLTDCSMILKPQDDITGKGVSLTWLTPDLMISESLDYYPGIVAHQLGYLPFGYNDEGSGEYYFLQTRQQNDPPVVRIRTKPTVEDVHHLDEHVELVCGRLSDFILKVIILGPDD